MRQQHTVCDFCRRHEEYDQPLWLKLENHDFCCEACARKYYDVLVSEGVADMDDRVSKLVAV